MRLNSRLLTILTISTLSLFLISPSLCPRTIVFYSPDCEECYEIIHDPLFQKLSTQKVTYLNINVTSNYEILLFVEETFGKRSEKFPIVVSGSNLFVGEEILPNIKKIESDTTPLPFPDSVLDKGILEGKPYWEEEIQSIRPTDTSVEKIYIAFFTKNSCEKCNRTEKMLLYFQKKYPSIVLKTFNTLDRNNQESQEAISLAYSVPENRRLIAPTIFIGDTFFVEDEITEKSLESVIEKMEEGFSVPPWEQGEGYKPTVSKAIQNRFKSFGSLVIFLAGLVDGVNPCAFATIVFFLSFMTLIGRSKREISITGITFVTVVFVVYLVIGLFLYRIASLNFLIPFRYALYYIIAAIAFILALVSVRDAVIIARGKPEKSLLRLPRFVKRKMERTIVKESKLRGFVISACISALVVSFLEFSCTGQVYIPTIFFVSSISGLRLKAVWFLILYNFAFIVPLILLFLLFVIGLSSERLYSFMRRRSFVLKIVTAVIFLILAVSLIVIR
jgi:thiol-disulfide isomerase/thioredoxin